MDAITWWTAFGAIAQAIGAVATFAAVAVSLWVVQSERQLQAKVTAGIRITFVGDGSPGVYWVGVTIVNTGMRAIRVTSTGWRTGWLSRGPSALTFRHAVQNTSLVNLGKRPPFVVEPGMQESVFTSVADMKGGNNPEAHADMFERRLPVLGDAPIQAVVNITGRNPVRVAVEPSLARFLRTMDHANTTADD
jgi:hypothetical protein